MIHRPERYGDYKADNKTMILLQLVNFEMDCKEIALKQSNFGVFINAQAGCNDDYKSQNFQEDYVI